MYYAQPKINSGYGITIEDDSENIYIGEKSGYKTNNLYNHNIAI